MPEITRPARNAWSVLLPNAEATDRFGAALGQRLQIGDIIALDGDLGMGKSALARAAIRARLAMPDVDVPSPTFTLVQVYEAADIDLWHVDLYRLDGAVEARQLGLDEAFLEAASLIEWPDHMAAELPPRAMWIRLSQAGDGRRAWIFAPPAWTSRLEEALANAG